MLNEDMMSPLQKRICELELKIKAFKEYDQKRQKLMYKIQGDLEEYSQKYLELKKMFENFQDGKTILELRQEVNRQKKEIHRLNSIVSNISEEKQQKMQSLIQEYKESLSIKQLRDQTKKYKKEIANLRAANSDFATLVAHLQKQIKENETENF